MEITKQEFVEPPHGEFSLPSLETGNAGSPFLGEGLRSEASVSPSSSVSNLAASARQKHKLLDALSQIGLSPAQAITALVEQLAFKPECVSRESVADTVSDSSVSTQDVFGKCRRSRRRRGKKKSSSLVTFTRDSAALPVVDGYCYQAVMKRPVDIGPFPTWRKLLDLPRSLFLAPKFLKTRFVVRVSAGKYHIGGTGVPFMDTCAVLAEGVRVAAGTLAASARRWSFDRRVAGKVDLDEVVGAFGIGTMTSLVADQERLILEDRMAVLYGGPNRNTSRHTVLVPGSGLLQFPQQVQAQLVEFENSRESASAHPPTVFVVPGRPDLWLLIPVGCLAGYHDDKPVAVKLPSAGMNLSLHSYRNILAVQGYCYSTDMAAGRCSFPLVHAGDMSGVRSSFYRAPELRSVFLDSVASKFETPSHTTYRLRLVPGVYRIIAPGIKYAAIEEFPGDTMAISLGSWQVPRSGLAWYTDRSASEMFVRCVSPSQFSMTTWQQPFEVFGWELDTGGFISN